MIRYQNNWCKERTWKIISNWYRFRITETSHERHIVRDYLPFECLLNDLFGLTTKKSKLRVTSPLLGNLPVRTVDSPHKGLVTPKTFPWHGRLHGVPTLQLICNHYSHVAWVAWWLNALHYADVIMATMASQITSLTVVYSSVYSDAEQRKHQSSASLAFVWGIHRDRWIPHTKGQWRGKCFHLMTSSWTFL